MTVRDVQTAPNVDIPAAEIVGNNNLFPTGSESYLHTEALSVKATPLRSKNRRYQISAKNGQNNDLCHYNLANYHNPLDKIMRSRMSSSLGIFDQPETRKRSPFIKKCDRLRVHRSLALIRHTVGITCYLYQLYFCYCSVNRRSAVD